MITYHTAPGDGRVAKARKRSAWRSACGIALLAAATATLGSHSAWGDPGADGQTFAGDVRLVLPPLIYAIPGLESNVYFDNVILTLNVNNYAFNVTCPVGLQYQERWAYTPASDELGDYPLNVEVRDESNAVLARGHSTVRVAAAKPPAGNPATLLMIGASFTEYSVYPGHVLELSRRQGAAPLRLIGSRGAGNMPPTGALQHEGYSGWTAEAFADLSGPLSRSGYHVRGATGSPFVYESADGVKSLDFARYCDEFNDGAAPDLVTIQLGTNDVFTSTDDTIDETIDQMFRHYDALIESIRAAGAGACIGVQMITPPSISQDGFRNYRGQGRQTRWQFRRNQHRLMERLLEHFGNRAADRIFLVPTYLNLDTAHHFPTWSPKRNGRSDQNVTRVNNGTHPDNSGYQQIGDVVYSWAVHMLAAAATLPADDAQSLSENAIARVADAEPPGIQASRVAWAGVGAYRLLLEVAPVDLRGRTSDEMPAQAEIDFVSLLDGIGVAGKADLRTIQIMQVDKATGRPVPYADYAYQRSPYDRAFRWYDGAIPYEFPEVLAPSSYTDGKQRRLTTIRAGYMYNAVGDWKKGKMSWSHTQVGQAPTYYAVYFDRIPSDEIPAAAPPAGWIGDAMPRRERWAETTTGADNTQIALDDWNEDGLIDIVYGEQYGQLFTMLNAGSREAPAFNPSRMLFDAEGLPLDVGVHASPLVIDWDEDGANDLLVGTYKNRIAFYRNMGTNRERILQYEGFLRDAAGEFLALPVTPVAVKSEGVFKEDYYPVPSATDWDNDGDIDLLCGGYITGRVYFFRNTGRRDGLPVLELAGPLVADGTPVNVRDWCASPCIADFNADGLPDLVVGSYTWHAQDVQRPSFLRYFVNTGSPADPRLQEKPLPVRGEVKPLRLPHPRATDWNNDGLIDLTVSTGSSIVIYPNVGSASEPLFDVDQQPIRAAWGNADAKVGLQVLDWNNDGWPDLVNRYAIRLNAGVGKPYFWNRTVAVLPPGVNIDHPVEMGDGHFYPYLHDLDRDGQIDVLFGDWHGHVWFHRRRSDSQEPQFDEQGVKLATSDGLPIKVGPEEGDGDSETSFQVLQGARTTLVAGDYNGDGRDDLVVGDTYGRIRYYQNLGPAELPKFAPPKLIADLKNRLKVERADFNSDGRLDVLASVSAHKIYVLLNECDGAECRFGDPFELPLQIKGPAVMVADLNRDGDDDLLINGTQGTSFVERSFIEYDYAPGRVVSIETIDADAKR